MVPGDTIPTITAIAAPNAVPGFSGAPGRPGRNRVPADDTLPPGEPATALFVMRRVNPAMRWLLVSRDHVQAAAVRFDGFPPDGSVSLSRCDGPLRDALSWLTAHLETAPLTAMWRGHGRLAPPSDRCPERFFPASGGFRASRAQEAA